MMTGAYVQNTSYLPSLRFVCVYVVGVSTSPIFLAVSRSVASFMQTLFSWHVTVGVYVTPTHTHTHNHNHMHGFMYDYIQQPVWSTDRATHRINARHTTPHGKIEKNCLAYIMQFTRHGTHISCVFGCAGVRATKGPHACRRRRARVQR